MISHKFKMMSNLINKSESAVLQTRFLELPSPAVKYWSMCSMVGQVPMMRHLHHTARGKMSCLCIKAV